MTDKIEEVDVKMPKLVPFRCPHCKMLGLFVLEVITTNTPRQQKLTIAGYCGECGMGYVSIENNREVLARASKAYKNFFLGSGRSVRSFDRN